MEKVIFGQTLALDTAPVHVAPGGSVLFTLNAKAASLARLLSALREEIAYGMIDIVADDADKPVRVLIYTGKADVADFDAVFSASGHDVECDREDIVEGTQMTGLSMRARNQVIDCLSK